MSKTMKKLKQDEKKVVLAYATIKLKTNRLLKELETMKQNVVDVFERSKQNLIIVQDENGNSFGLQRIRRKRKKFETASFKLKHNDLFNQFCNEIEYSEYKAIGDNQVKRFEVIFSKNKSTHLLSEKFTVLTILDFVNALDDYKTKMGLKREDILVIVEG